MTNRFLQIPNCAKLLGKFLCARKVTNRSESLLEASGEHPGVSRAAQVGGNGMLERKLQRRLRLSARKAQDRALARPLMAVPHRSGPSKTCAIGRFAGGALKIRMIPSLTEKYALVPTNNCATPRRKRSVLLILPR